VRIEGLYVLIPYLECRSLRPNWRPPPSLPQASASPPGTKGGGATHACGGGDKGRQIGRTERKPGTLSTLSMCVYTFASILLIFKRHLDALQCIKLGMQTIFFIFYTGSRLGNQDSHTIPVINTADGDNPLMNAK
jgi:hypothetical protein